MVKWLKAGYGKSASRFRITVKMVVFTFTEIPLGKMNAFLLLLVVRVNSRWLATGMDNGILKTYVTLTGARNKIVTKVRTQFLYKNHRPVL